MKDKEQQIEEMAKVINNPMLNYCRELNKCKEICQYSGKSCRQYTCRDYAYAETLHKVGYRKLPENAVVLSREEYDNLKLQIQQAHNKGVRAGFDLTKFKENSIEQARKETAKEIATHIKSLLDDCKDVNIKMHYAGLLVWLQIAFGLEVEE